MDPYMDLIIWYFPDGGIYGFQLSYDKEGDERCLTWLHTGSFTHTRIDSGEAGPLDAKCTPVPVAGGLFDQDEVRKQFEKRSALIDPSLRSLVLLKLAEATLAKLPAVAEQSIFLKNEAGETGPFSEAELVSQIQLTGLPAGQMLRLGDERVWRSISEYFPNQFPSKPRTIQSTS